MAMQSNIGGAAPRTSLLNDPVIRGIIYQVIVAALVVALISWLVFNTAQNLAAQNKSTGFDFLFRTAGFDISFTLFPWSRTSFYWQAFLAGLLNTLLVAVVGIFFATILGFTLGIARLSSNWLISRFATIYVETIRNIPLLLQLFFWYFAVLKAMPAVRDSFELPLDIFINQRGMMVPRPLIDHEFTWVLVALAVSIVAAIAIARWAMNVRTLTGAYPHSIIVAARAANALVTFGVSYVALLLLVGMAPSTDAASTIVLVGAVALTVATFTPLAIYVKPIVAFMLATVVLASLIGGMFSFLPSTVVIIGSVLAGLGFGWVQLEGAARSSESKFPIALPLLVAIGVPALVYWLTGASLQFEVPELNRFNFKGGVQLPPEFVALVFGLTIYTASFIAENVRGGIQAVNHGQTEAAQSLGLKEGDRLRLVIIPQAMRVIVPPLTSQYLNLTKNSSLGAAIGYPELVNVFTGTTLNQTGKAIEVIAMTMAVYLTFSLVTSAFMNWYNGRVALVER